MLSIIALVGGGWTMHVLLQRFVLMSMARVARAEAENLDAELRNLNGRNEH